MALALDPELSGPKSRGPNRQTAVLIEILEDMLDHAAGDLTPLLDDIDIEFRHRMGGRLHEAHQRVRTSLDTALEWLHKDGWYWVKVTDYYVEHYRGLPGDAKHPQTQADIVRSVAGSSVGAVTVAIHFCPGDDCVLFMQAFCHGSKSGERKVRANVTRMRDMAEAGLLTPDGITRIAAEAGLGARKDVTKAMRIAARANQRTPLEKTDD